MQTISHIAYPALTFIAGAHVLGFEYRVEHLVVLTAFSILPDADFIYQIVKRRKFDESYKHHQWLSHWPVIYTPFIILFFVFPSIYTFLMLFGLFSHFILDSFFCVDGIMWTYPVSKRFTNHFSPVRSDEHGPAWFAQYRKLLIFKLDILAFSVLLVVLFIKFL